MKGLFIANFPTQSGRAKAPPALVKYRKAYQLALVTPGNKPW